MTLFTGLGPQVSVPLTVMAPWPLSEAIHGSLLLSPFDALSEGDNFLFIPLTFPLIAHTQIPLTTIRQN